MLKLLFSCRFDDGNDNNDDDDSYRNTDDDAHLNACQQLPVELMCCTHAPSCLSTCALEGPVSITHLETL